MTQHSSSNNTSYTIHSQTRSHPGISNGPTRHKLSNGEPLIAQLPTHRWIIWSSSSVHCPIFCSVAVWYWWNLSLHCFAVRPGKCVAISAHEADGLPLGISSLRRSISFSSRARSRGMSWIKAFTWTGIISLAYLPLVSIFCVHHKHCLSLLWWNDDHQMPRLLYPMSQAASNVEASFILSTCVLLPSSTQRSGTPPLVSSIAYSLGLVSISFSWKKVGMI